ncbi:hypothetical protein V1508DRAFT_434436 [Lipomyces doorenjongii]|uniref:uncharacterized protein n=1 Tax=Lipomyces doorenjongii TaxID=383834 RepID=UPI0034CD07D0
MTPKVIVVTGTNRGIGLALATEFSQRGDIVLATVRSKAKVIGTPLAALPNVKLVEMEADDFDSIDNATAEIEDLAPEGIDELWNNLGVLNVGYGASVTSVRSVNPGDMASEYKINVIAPSYLTSKLLPLLEKRQTRKIVFLSSIVGSLEFSKEHAQFMTKMEVPYSYSTTKTALNMAAWYFHNQLNSAGFTIVPIHPGVVLTDMNGPRGQISTEESVTGMIGVVDALSAADDFLLRSYDGSIIPW